MACYIGEEIDISREVEWYDFDGLLDCQSGGDVLLQVAREINEREDQFGQTKTVWPYVSTADPADGAMSGIDWDAHGTWSPFSLWAVMMDQMRDRLRELLVLAQNGWIDSGAHKWYITSASSIRSTMDGALSALNYFLAEDWQAWITALRVALDAIVQKESLSWGSANLYVRLKYVSDYAYGSWGGKGGTTGTYGYDTTVTESDPGRWTMDDGGFDYPGSSGINEFEGVSNNQSSTYISGFPGSASSPDGPADPEEIADFYSLVFAVNTDGGAMGSPPSSPGSADLATFDRSGWLALFRRDITWSVGLYNISGDLVAPSELFTGFTHTEVVDVDSEAELNITVSKTPASISRTVNTSDTYHDDIDFTFEGEIVDPTMIFAESFGYYDSFINARAGIPKNANTLLATLPVCIDANGKYHHAT